MIDIDLRGQLMGTVSTNHNYSKDVISNSNESSFDNIFDKAQFKQQKSETHIKERLDYTNNKEIIRPKEDRYDKKVDNKDINNNKVSEQKPVKDKDNDKKEKEVVNTDKESVNTDKKVTDKNNEVNNGSNEVSGENKEEVQDKTEINQKLENEILMLLSQMAGIDEEEIANWLMESGYEVSDLLDTKMFGEIISNLYLELKNEDVLLLENVVEDINEIYKEIKELENEIISNSKSVANNNSSSESIEAAMLSGNIENANVEPVTQDGNTIATLQSIETNKYLPVKQPVASEEIKQVNSVSGQLVEGSSTDLQSVMPVSQFRTAGKLDFWSNEVLNTTKSNMMPTNFEIDIIKQIDLKQIGMSKELHIELNPRELGKMSIKLVEENSNIVAQISVDNEKTKDLLISQIDILKKSLEENGLNIEDVTVDIKQNSHESQMQQEKQKSSKRIEELINKHMSGDDFDDDIVDQIKISEVDYIA